MHVARITWVSAVLLSACLPATQVTFELRTDVPCDEVGQVGVAVGTADEVEAVSLQPVQASCSSDGMINVLGTYAAKPGSAELEVGVRVVMSALGETLGGCSTQNGCITARRTLRFVPRRGLMVPVDLFRVCRDVPCDAVTTCNQLGRCVPAAVDLANCVGARCESTVPPSDQAVVVAVAARSSWLAEPPSLDADGMSESVVTLTLNDALTAPLAGAPVEVRVEGQLISWWTSGDRTDDQGRFRVGLKSTRPQTAKVVAHAAGVELVASVVFDPLQRLDGGVELYLGWESLNPVPLGSTVWARSVDDVWLLADRASWNNLLHWNGEGWTAWRPAEGLFDAWGSAADDVWFVGRDGALVHWNGRAPIRVPSGVTTPIGSLSGTSATDVWAAGEDGVCLHWDGVRWTQRGPMTRQNFTDVWAVAPDDVWLLADSDVFRFDGTTWTSSTRTGGTLRSVHGSSPIDVWIGADTALWHWNGLAWSNVATGSTGAVTQLWSRSPTEVWGVQGGASIRGINGVFRQIGPGVGASDVGGDGSDVWVVAGGQPFRGDGGVLFDTSVQRQVLDVPRTLWAHQQEAYVSLLGGSIAAWTGTSWTSGLQSIGVVDGLTGIASGDAWAVNSAGEVSTLVSGQWRRGTSTAPVNYGRIWASNAGVVWIVGEAGATARWDGLAWTSFPAMTRTNFGAVSGTATNDVWAVGREGVIEHWNGTQWKSIPSSTALDLFSVFAASRTAVWASGVSGLQAWNGTRWTRVADLDRFTHSVVCGRSAADVWLVGRVGPVTSAAHWDGTSWSLEEVPISVSVWSPAACQVLEDGTLWVASPDQSTSGGVYRRR